MTISELRELIEELEESGLGDAEVRLATQPAWPFEYSLSPAFDIEGKNGDSPVLYLAEGRQIGYLPGDVKDNLTCQGWG